MKLQLHEFIKNLLENEFNDLFYNHGLKQVCEYFECTMKVEDNKAELEPNSSRDFSMIQGLDLINKCLLEDNFRFKPHML